MHTKLVALVSLLSAIDAAALSFSSSASSSISSSSSSSSSSSFFTSSSSRYSSSSSAASTSTANARPLYTTAANTAAPSSSSLSASSSSPISTSSLSSSLSSSSLSRTSSSASISSSSSVVQTSSFSSSSSSSHVLSSSSSISSSSSSASTSFSSSAAVSTSSSFSSSTYSPSSALPSSTSSSSAATPTAIGAAVRPVAQTRPVAVTAAPGVGVGGNAVNLPCSVYPQWCVQTTTSKASSSSKTSSSSSSTKSSTSTTTKAATTSSSSSSTTKSSTSTTSSSSTLTTKSTATPTPTSSSTNCYLDYYPNYRVMNGSSTSSNTMTPADCTNYCNAAGYEFSGTQYSSQCYCSHTSPTVPTTNCNMACSGDSTKICGGANALSVVYSAPSTALENSATTNSKRGLCWPYNNAGSTFGLFNPAQETWVYNWEMWTPLPGTSFSSAQYVGLVHDTSRLEQIAWYYTSSSRASPYLLGFNEPDLSGTAVSVSDAVTYWQQYFLPLRKSYGTILGAPAVTNAVASGMGIDWLNQFNAACQDTTTVPGTTRSCFDLIPLHWYGYFLYDFQNYVTNFHNQYPSYPLWITEFAFTDHDAQSTAILAKSAMAWLDAQPFVARYSMFGPMNAANMAGITNGAMISDDLSQLTQVGLVYTGQA